MSKIIPDVTRLAWREKRKEILAAMPGVRERDVVYTMTQRQYEQAFGTKYRKQERDATRHLATLNASAEAR